MATSSPLLAGRMTDYWLTVYKRSWRGSVISSFVTPLLYVLAMGVLLGGFIKGDPAKLEGATSYLMFVAPGMVAAQ
jgi:lipooligosaccharide transport system permease protein